MTQLAIRSNNVSIIAIKSPKIVLFGKLALGVLVNGEMVGEDDGMLPGICVRNGEGALFGEFVRGIQSSLAVSPSNSVPPSLAKQQNSKVSFPRGNCTMKEFGSPNESPAKHELRRATSSTSSHACSLSAPSHAGKQ